MANHHASAPREALAFHLAFGIIALLAVMFTSGHGYGLAVLALAIAYNLLLPGYALLRGYSDWIARWAFLLPVSMGQVLPDWTLVRISETLVFPDHGIARIGGDVPVYFMGLWIMLLFPITLFADATNRARYLVAARLALLLFGAAEWAAPMLQLWQPRNIDTVAGVALYTLPAEILLCLACLRLYRRTRHDGVFARLWAAMMIVGFYCGALMISLLAFGGGG